MYVNTNQSNPLRGKDLINIKDFDREEIGYILDVVKDLKQRVPQEEITRTLDRKRRYMMFCNSSFRTMNSFSSSMNQEVTDKVIDGPQSVVFDEAGNRLHAQKAVISPLMR